MTPDTRALLRELVTEPVAEYMYTAAVSGVPLSRSILLRLGDMIPGLRAPGDVVDRLLGRWLEPLENGRFRVTPMLQDAAREVWSPERVRVAHARIHDAIREEKVVSPAEAAAMLFHAFLAQDSRRMFKTAAVLQLLDNEQALDQTYRHLLWLPYVALKAEQRFTEDGRASAFLRALQFHVTEVLEGESIEEVATRWGEEVEAIEYSDLREVSRQYMWGSFLTCKTGVLPIRFRLAAIQGLGNLGDEARKLSNNAFVQAATKSAPDIGAPAGATSTQLSMVLCTGFVRSLSALRDLVSWLDQSASPEFLQGFDEIIEWPFVQTMGAFVQSAWSGEHESVTDWEPWLQFLAEAAAFAKRRNLPRFGREAAKARSIILSEYLGRHDDALGALETARADFGDSVVLAEQEANALFQLGDDARVLDAWHKLTGEGTDTNVPDPFAFRRAGMSASRLSRWGEAEQIFLAGCEVIEPGSLQKTRVGLQIDASLAAARGGKLRHSVVLLGNTLGSLPPEAVVEGDGHWEAIQRYASEVCRCIDAAAWRSDTESPRIRPGDASSPSLKDFTASVGQPLRSQLARVASLRLAASLDAPVPSFLDDIEPLRTSVYPIVRCEVAAAMLSFSLSRGAGIGFIESLVRFDHEVALLGNLGEAGAGTPDSGESLQGSGAPERWLGLLIAGLCCAAGQLNQNLDIWLADSRRIVGPNSQLSCVIESMGKAATLRGLDAVAAVKDQTRELAERCGAAAALLQSSEESANHVLVLQLFLASALLSDASSVRQDLWNKHVAMRFAQQWMRLSASAFQFQSPRTSIPQLAGEVAEVEAGRGSLKRLLTAAASALGQKVGDVAQRLR